MIGVGLAIAVLVDSTIVRVVLLPATMHLATGPGAAHRGQHTEAERLVREAVEIVEPSDWLVSQGDTRFDLGEVLSAAGRPADAAAAFREALGCYERKQNLPLARRARERLAALQEP